MTNYLVVGLLVTVLPAIAHADQGRVNDYVQKEKSSGFCVDYTNVGAKPEYLGIINGCGSAVTAETVNRHSNGTIAARRTFHLVRDENRKNIGLPGYSTEITGVSPFSPGVSCDDGFGRMNVYSRQVDEQTVFTVKNLDAQRFLAVYFKIYRNGAPYGWTWDVIPPGQSNDRFYGGLTADYPLMSLQWSCLDPL
ncbi:hypothetical protein [Bradyrhizobium sp. RT10b]|uniref:hypothetical protein n=1 Tax=Bradyrhizobium sp. RT10b TaxID=3156331 RepID=UPI0033941699